MEKKITLNNDKFEEISLKSNIIKAELKSRYTFYKLKRYFLQKKY